jgi:glycosyltransferase involved in cell wall biosynthesis
MGCPVVASDHGGAREQVVGNRTAFLYPPGDAAQLGKKIREVLVLDADQRERLAEEARAHVKANFDKRHMCAATLALYREILRAEAVAGP